MRLGNLFYNGRAETRSFRAGGSSMPVERPEELLRIIVVYPKYIVTYREDMKLLMPLWLNRSPKMFMTEPMTSPTFTFSKLNVPFLALRYPLISSANPAT
jgi:hypothetical protein